MNYISQKIKAVAAIIPLAIGLSSAPADSKTYLPEVGRNNVVKVERPFLNKDILSVYRQSAGKKAITTYEPYTVKSGETIWNVAERKMTIGNKLPNSKEISDFAYEILYGSNLSWKEARSIRAGDVIQVPKDWCRL